MADPSLLVPAAQAWADDGSLRRWLPRPQELLLGRARPGQPGLPRAGRRPAPGAARARSIWTPTAPITSCPSPPRRWTRPGSGSCCRPGGTGARRLGLTASAHTPADGVVEKAGKFGRDQLMDFRWQLAVGDDTLTEEEIAALAADQGPAGPAARPVGGGRPRSAPARPGVPGPRTVRAGHRGRDPRAGRQPSGRPRTRRCRSPGCTADGWLGELLGGSVAQSLRPVPLPAHFQATLRPYQERGLSWLAFLSSLGLGACLADDMGLGKTVQLLALEAAHRAERPGRPARRCCCARCRWSATGSGRPPSSRPACGSTPTTGRSGCTGTRSLTGWREADLIVTTYATATRDIDELAGYEWQRVVLDEAQAIKNSLSQAAKAVRRLRADHRVALTGTPVENRLAELWSIMDFLNPGMLGSAEQFRTRYAIPVERHGQTEPAERLRADHPALRAAPAQDRPGHHRRPAGEDRDQAVLPAHRRAGLAVSVGRGRHDGEDRELRGDRAPRQRAGGDDQAQAGVQPPGAAAARPLADRAPVGQGDPAGGDPARRSSPRATRCCASPSSPSSPRCCCRTWPRGSARTSPTCTAAPRRSAATRW